MSDELKPLTDLLKDLEKDDLVKIAWEIRNAVLGQCGELSKNFEYRSNLTKAGLVYGNKLTQIGFEVYLNLESWYESQPEIISKNLGIGECINPRD